MKNHFVQNLKTIDFNEIQFENHWPIETYHIFLPLYKTSYGNLGSRSETERNR